MSQTAPEPASEDGLGVVSQQVEASPSGTAGRADVAEEVNQADVEFLESLAEWQPGEHLLAIARGKVQPYFAPEFMAGHGIEYGERFDGELRLTEEAIYVTYRKKSYHSSTQTRMGKRELTSWKHFEQHGFVGIELATDEFSFQTMLKRSEDSDPDAFIEFCRSIEDDDLLLDAVFAYSAILVWELRQVPDHREYKEAAAATVEVVRDTHPAVFVTAAELMAVHGTQTWTEDSINDSAIDSIIQDVAERSGYIEARRTIQPD